MALVNKNKGLKEEYPMETFSAEYDFPCVRQIAHADRFAFHTGKGINIGSTFDLSRMEFTLCTTAYFQMCITAYIKKKL